MSTDAEGETVRENGSDRRPRSGLTSLPSPDDTRAVAGAHHVQAESTIHEDCVEDTVEDVGGFSYGGGDDPGSVLGVDGLMSRCRSWPSR